MPGRIRMGAPARRCPGRAGAVRAGAASVGRAGIADVSCIAAARFFLPAVHRRNIHRLHGAWPAILPGAPGR